jgi:acyl dehydratase
VADEDIGVDFARVVHGDQEFVWARPLRAGETLEAQTTVESIRVRGPLEFLTLRTDMRDEHRDIVVTARSRMIVRSGA